MAKRKRSRLAGTPDDHSRIADRDETRVRLNAEKAVEAVYRGACKIAYQHATEAHKHFGSFWSNVAMARENPHHLRQRGADVKSVIKDMDASVNNCIRSRKRKG
jgi:3',5'-cyclic AMP phosphodiesterase CpdA